MTEHPDSKPVSCVRETDICENDYPESVIAQWAMEYRVLWKVYKWKSIIFFVWMGSREEVRMIFKFLYCNQSAVCFHKAQNKNCATAIVADRGKSSIMALMAITSLLLPSANDVYWLCRAFWIASVFCSILSASYACKHMKFIGNVLLENEKDIWTFKRWYQEDKCSEIAKPLLSVVLLFSGSKMFFDSAVIAYVAGMGIYLGTIWRQTSLSQNLDASSNQDDNRNIFVVSLVIALTFWCFYLILGVPPHPQKRQEWTDIRCHLREKHTPWLCTESCWKYTDTKTCGNGMDRKQVKNLEMCDSHNPSKRWPHAEGVTHQATV